MNQDTLDAFQRLNDILDTLRHECPWDSVQTLASLRYLTIEEVFELNEAILQTETALSPKDTNKANNELKKELGDLFMHLLFYSKIAEEEHRFTTTDVLNAICNKLIDRHPFIFHKDDYHGESWEQIKMHEGRHSVLDGVPAGLPALVKAIRLQEKAAGIGYSDIPSPSPLPNEVNEQQFGELLFTLIHWAHNQNINADDALSKANRRFEEKVREFEEKTHKNKEGKQC